MVLFLGPVQGDLQLANAIFELFESASVLIYNVVKCQLVPIGCDTDQVVLAQQLFPCPIKESWIKYPVIPLSTGKLPKAAFQLLIDKMADKLSAWRGRLMHRSGRLTLIKTTLAAIPVSCLPSLGAKGISQDFQSLLVVMPGINARQQVPSGLGQGSAPASAGRPGRPRSKAYGMCLACVCDGYGFNALTLTNLGPQCQCLMMQRLGPSSRRRSQSPWGTVSPPSFGPSDG
jgi:hypothetical protein